MKDIDMQALTIFINEDEGWCHVLVCEVSPASGAHTVVQSITHYPMADKLMDFATTYARDVGVDENWCHIFRAERISP
jgi:hypothetical protein